MRQCNRKKSEPALSLPGLAAVKEFLTATDGSVKSERMLDREFVLRFVSFCYLGLEKYTGNIDEFLNEGMKYLNRADSGLLEEICTA